MMAVLIMDICNILGGKKLEYETINPGPKTEENNEEKTAAKLKMPGHFVVSQVYTLS